MNMWGITSLFVCLGDWCEADRHSVWLDLAQRRYSEGGRHPHCKGRHWRYCWVPRTWCWFHLLHRYNVTWALVFPLRVVMIRAAFLCTEDNTNYQSNNITGFRSQVWERLLEIWNTVSPVRWFKAKHLHIMTDQSRKPSITPKRRHIQFIAKIPCVPFTSG